MDFNINKNFPKESLINYDSLARDALQYLIYKLLKMISIDGLPGRHHFYISFTTKEKSIILPRHLKKQYPEEMTIVLQNSYWDLIVKKDYFRITLSFDGERKQLHIPFSSITSFSDPEANINLIIPKGSNKLIKGTEINKNIVNIDQFRKGK
jgi:hypothetical protein